MLNRLRPWPLRMPAGAERPSTTTGRTFLVISKEDRIVSKRASGREMDLDDVRLLELPDQDMNGA